jgi:SAM-dependent methyltransferase
VSPVTGSSRVMLNLGAGLQYRPGWTNYDRSRVAAIYRRPWLRRLVRLVGVRVQDWPEATRTRDLNKGIPHPDESVDAIYSSHFLEHLWPEQAEFIVQECHRVLKPGGTLRLVVPDLELIARKYLEGDRAFFNESDRPIADTFVDALKFRSRPKGRAPERLLRRFLRTDEGGHRWMYDGASLSDRLARAGFREIEVVGYRDGRDREVAALDSRPRSSVHIEARK